MTDKEIEKLYKDQLEQHFLNFLEGEKEEISNMNMKKQKWIFLEKKCVQF